MKYVLFLLVFVSTLTHAMESEPPQDQEVLAFAKTMGLDSMLQGVLEQTRQALKNSMVDLSANIINQFPDLTEEQNSELLSIFDKYVDTIMDSVNTDHAAYLYAQEIARGMSKEEIETANNYYSSPQGQNTLKTVSAAANQLNQYILDQITSSTKVAQAELIKDIQQFRIRINHQQ